MTIPHKNIILSSKEKLKYYSIPLWTLGIFTFMTVVNWKEYIKNAETNVLLKISFLIIMLSIISLVLKIRNLKLIKINHNWSLEELKNRLKILSTQENWKIDISDEEKIIFIKTRPSQSKRFIIHKSEGEKIFLYYSNNEIYFKSILYSANNFGLAIPIGENKENERLIINCLKPTANNV